MASSSGEIFKALWSYDPGCDSHRHCDDKRCIFSDFRYLVSISRSIYLRLSSALGSVLVVSSVMGSVKFWCCCCFCYLHFIKFPFCLLVSTCIFASSGSREGFCTSSHEKLGSEPEQAQNQEQISTEPMRSSYWWCIYVCSLENSYRKRTIVPTTSH